MNTSDPEQSDFFSDAQLMAAFDAAMASLLKNIPSEEREAVRLQCMLNLQTVLAEAPTRGDVMDTLRIRARLAALFFSPRVS